MTLINIGIAGCLGRMGRELVKNLTKDDRVNFSGGFEHPEHKDLNKSFSTLLDIKNAQQVISNADKIFSDSDVVIDFTSPTSTKQNLIIAEKHTTPIVIGTTGLSPDVSTSIKEASKDIPILYSANMSLGVNLLFHLVQQSATTLDKINYDIEISETHHKHKIDAPSGTAIVLGEYAAKGRQTDFSKAKVYDRSNSMKKRHIGEIGFSVTRGGEIAGEHTVSFIGAHDRIDLSHKAFNRSIFVKGAIEAAIFLSKQKIGLYTMEDVIKS